MKHRYLAITLLLAASPTLLAQAPVIESVRNTFSSGEELSPGALATVRGQNLSAAPEFCTSGADPLPTIIPPCNAMVLINGEPAPIRVNSAEVIDFLIPSDEPAGKGTPPASVEIVLDVAGARSEPVMVELQRFSPAIATDRGFGDFRRATPVENITLENRAVPGETIRVTATGLGPTDPPIPTGFSGFETLVAQPKVLIRGAAKAVREAEVLSALGFGQGNNRVEFVLPEDLPLPIDPNYFYGVELVIEDKGEVFTSPQVNLPVAVGEHQITGVGVCT